MKRTNAVLLAAIALTIGGGIYAASDPAKTEFRNIGGSEMDLFEFAAVQKAATQPTTQPQPGGDFVRRMVRVCTSTGEPMRDVLVEAIQYRGGAELLADSCVTGADGICTLTIERTANGRIQITQQREGVIFAFKQQTPAAEITSCQPTSMPIP